MVKSEWGTRYTCYKCEALFYDLNKPEPICPKCDANQTKETTTKSSTPSPRARARTVMPEEPEVVEDKGDDVVKGVDGKEVDQGEAEEST